VGQHWQVWKPPPLIGKLLNAPVPPLPVEDRILSLPLLAIKGKRNNNAVLTNITLQSFHIEADQTAVGSYCC
jgi:hypothetical protein